MKIRDILLVISLLMSAFLMYDYVKRTVYADTVPASSAKSGSKAEEADQVEPSDEGESREVIAQFAEALYETEEDPYMGKSDAKHKVVVFMDPYCAPCKQMAKQLKDLVAKRSDIKVIYKVGKFIGNPESDQAARELIAAQKQGKFTDYIAALSKSAAANDEERMDIARDSGLNVKQLTADADNAEVRRVVEDNQFLAGKVGVRGLPSLIIGGALRSGVLDNAAIEKLVDASAGK